MLSEERRNRILEIVNHDKIIKDKRYYRKI